MPTPVKPESALERLRRLAGETEEPEPKPQGAVQGSALSRLEAMAAEGEEEEYVAPGVRKRVVEEVLATPITKKPPAPKAPATEGADESPGLAERYKRYLRRGDETFGKAGFERGEFTKGAAAASGSILSSFARALDVSDRPRSKKASEIYQQRFGAEPPPAKPSKVLSTVRDVGDALTEANPPKVGSYKDVKGVGDAVDYAAYALGSGVTSTGPVLIAALTGGAPVAAAVGYLQNTGSIEKDLEELKVDPAKKDQLAAALGIPVAALDVMGADALAALVKRGLAERIGKGMASRMARGAAAEGATEGAQNIIEHTGTRAATGTPISGAELAQSTIDAAIQGGLAGGAISATPGQAQTAVDPNPPVNPAKEWGDDLRARSGQAQPSTPTSPVEPAAPPPPVDEEAQYWAQYEAIVNQLKGEELTRMLVQQQAMVEKIPPDAPAYQVSLRKLEIIRRRAQALARGDEEVVEEEGDASQVLGMPVGDNEHIVAPAIQTPDGKVYAGGTAHDEILQWARKIVLESKDPALLSVIDSYATGAGFLTSNGRFVSRKEAIEIMRQTRPYLSGSSAASPDAYGDRKYGHLPVGEVQPPAPDEPLSDPASPDAVVEQEQAQPSSEDDDRLLASFRAENNAAVEAGRAPRDMTPQEEAADDRRRERERIARTARRDALKSALDGARGPVVVEDEVGRHTVTPNADGSATLALQGRKPVRVESMKKVVEFFMNESKSARPVVTTADTKGPRPYLVDRDEGRQAMPTPGSPSPQLQRSVRLQAMSAKSPVLRRIKGFLGNRQAQQEVASLHRIVAKLYQDFNVPLRQGRGNLKRMRALGWYHPQSMVVRIGRSDRASTGFHEFGHFVSDKFLKQPTQRGAQARGAARLTPPMVGELTAMGKALYGPRKPAGGYAEEGIAQWARFYITEPQRILAEAPNFTLFMEDQVFKQYPELKASLDQTRDAFDLYRSASPEAKVESIIDRGDGTESLLHRLTNFREITRSWFDRVGVFKEAVDALSALRGARPATAQDAYQLARLMGGVPAFVAEQLESGIVDLTTGKPMTKGYYEVVESIPADRREAFERYLVAERVLEEFGKGVEATSITVEEASAVAEEGRKEFGAAAKELWKISQAMIEQRVQVGLLTPLEGEKIKSLNQKRYGPMSRIFEDGEAVAAGRGGSSKRAGQNSPAIGTLRGSGRDIVPPLEALFQDINRTAHIIHSHRVGIALIDFAVGTKGGGGIVEELIETPLDHMAFSSRMIEQQLADMGVDLDAFVDKKALRQMAAQWGVDVFDNGQPRKVKDIIDDLRAAGAKKKDIESATHIAGILHAWAPRTVASSRETKDLVLPKIVNGERKWFAVKDADLYRAMEAMDHSEIRVWHDMFGNVVGRGLTGAARTLRAGATLAPEFGAGNIVRDAMTAFVYSRGPTHLPGYLHLRGFFEMIQQKRGVSETVREWKRSLGGGSTLQAQDRRSIQDEMKRRLGGTTAERYLDPLLHPVEFLRAIGDVIESAARIGEFAEVREQKARQGRSVGQVDVEAGAASAEVTLNFPSGGTAAKKFGQIVSFFNPAAIDYRKFYLEFIRTTDPARRKKLIARSFVGLTLPSIALALAQADDEEYMAIPMWQKNAHWIWIERDETGKVLRRWRIPKPQLLGFLFGTIPERIVLGLKHSDPEQYKSLLGALGQQVIPNLIPTLLAPLIENYSNRSFLRGAPIVPRSRQDLIPEEQASDYTGETARQIGQAVDYSPAKIENLARGWFGTLGADVTEQITDRAVRAGREALGKAPLPTSTTRQQDWQSRTPILKRFMAREPLEDAESVQRLYSEFFKAEAKRRTYNEMVRRQETHRAREYLDENRAAILSVGTERELGEDQMGPLREAYMLLNELRSQASTMSPEQRAELGRRVRYLAEQPNVKAAYDR